MTQRKIYCPNCNYYFEKNKYLYECKSCGLGKTKRINVNSFIKDFSAIDKLEKSKKLNRYKHIYKRYFNSIFSLKGNVLEIGCSEGLFLDFLRKNGWDVKGLDPNPGDNKKKDYIINSTFNDFTFKEKYDLIILFHCLEHFPYPDDVLKRCRNILHDTGKIFIIVSNYDGWWYRIEKENWAWLAPEHHYYHYTVNSIKKILLQQNFKNITISTPPVTDSPSLINVYISTKGYFNSGLFSIWPLSSIVFKITNKLKFVSDLLASYFLSGAEIHVIAIK